MSTKQNLFDNGSVFTASSEFARFLFISNIIYIFIPYVNTIYDTPDGDDRPADRPTDRFSAAGFTYLTAGQVSRAVCIIVYDDCGREQGIISGFARETRLLSHKLLSAPAIIYPPTSQLCFNRPSS